MLLRHCMCILWHIAHNAHYNKMSSTNLGVCIGQSLLFDGRKSLTNHSIKAQTVSIIIIYCDCPFTILFNPFHSFIPSKWTLVCVCLCWCVCFIACCLIMKLSWPKLGIGSGTGQNWLILAEPGWNQTRPLRANTNQPFFYFLYHFVLFSLFRCWMAHFIGINIYIRMQQFVRLSLHWRHGAVRVLNKSSPFLLHHKPFTLLTWPKENNNNLLGGFPKWLMLSDNTSNYIHVLSSSESVCWQQVFVCLYGHHMGIQIPLGNKYRPQSTDWWYSDSNSSSRTQSREHPPSLVFLQSIIASIVVAFLRLRSDLIQFDFNDPIWFIVCLNWPVLASIGFERGSPPGTFIPPLSVLGDIGSYK